MTKLLPHLTVMIRIPDSEERIGFTRGGFVPVALDEQPFARTSTVDVFPCLRRAE